MTHNETKDISKLRQATNNNSLPAYAWPGGYPLFYFDAENNVLCPACANENDEFSAELNAYDINYEDEFLFCDHCSEHIQSAYGEDT